MPSPRGRSRARPDGRGRPAASRRRAGGVREILSGGMIPVRTIRSSEPPYGYRSSRTRIGRSSTAHARSAVSTSGGSLRIVRARQQRSPRESERPPDNERMAPASSASCSRTGAIVTPAAARSSRTRTTSISASTSLPMTSARFAAPRIPESRLAATRSAPGSSCTRARMADASRTVIRSGQQGGARLTVHRRGIALWVVPRRVGVARRRHPAGVRAPIVGRIDVGAADRPGSTRVPSAPRRVSPGGLVSRARGWHPSVHHATVTTNMSPAFLTRRRHPFP